MGVLSTLAGALRPAARVVAGACVCLCVALPALAQQAQDGGVKTLPDDGGIAGMGMQVAGALFLILGLMFAGFWVLKRYGARAGLGVFGSGQIKIEGTMGIGTKKSIVVVRFLNKRLVLGVTDSNINLLTEMEADNDDERKDFAQDLDEASAKDGAD